MNKDKVSKWQRKIEDTFCGLSGIVGENIFELRKLEQNIFQKLITRFKGFVCLMDAFFDFYIETLQFAASRPVSKLSELTALITAIHVPSFWRLRASYIVFWDGYYVDALSLLRAIFENVLQIAALKLKIISIDEARGKVKNKDLEKMSDDEVYKEIQKCISKSDKKIVDYLIGKNSGLSCKYISDYKVFLKNLHNAVHKCRINLVWYYGPWIKGERTYPIFPEYDEDLASLYLNYSEPIAWMLLRTFPLLQIRKKEFPDYWYKKYNVLDESFEEAIKNLPKNSGLCVVELVNSKFIFNE